MRSADRCAVHADAVRQFFREEPEDEPPAWLRWWEVVPRWRYRGSFISNGRISMAPVDIGPMVQDKLLVAPGNGRLHFRHARAGSSGDGFAFFSAGSGLAQVARKEREVRFKALGSPFDYSGQARCLVVTNLPEPRSGADGDARYIQGLSGVIGDALTASRGRGLVLFTSYRVLERVADELFPVLEGKGISPASSRSAIPATSSCWAVSGRKWGRPSSPRLLSGKGWTSRVSPSPW